METSVSPIILAIGGVAWPLVIALAIRWVLAKTRFWEGAKPNSVAMVVVGLLCTGVAAWLSSGFYSVPTGCSIRPMGWSAALFGDAFVGLAFATCLGLTGYPRESRRWLYWCGLVLCLAPVPTGFSILIHAIKTNGFILSQ